MTFPQVYLLDSEGLSQAVRGDRRMGARLKDADGAGIRVMTTPMTLIETYHDKIRHAAWQWTLSKIRVEPITKTIADTAIGLLRDTGMHGHRHAIDATLMAVALQQGAPVTIFTSDEDDMRNLCGDRVVIVKL